MLAANSRAHVDCVSRVLKNADRLPQAPVPPLILDSWRRSMDLYRLDPGSQQGPRILSQSLLNECRERAELFLRIWTIPEELRKMEEISSYTHSMTIRHGSGPFLSQTELLP